MLGLRRRYCWIDLAFLAVEHVADHAAALGIYFVLVAALDRVLGLRFDFRLFRFTATGAAVGEAWFVGLQLKFLSANDASLNGKNSHNQTIVAKMAEAVEWGFSEVGWIRSLITDSFEASLYRDPN